MRLCGAVGETKALVITGSLLLVALASLIFLLPSSEAYVSRSPILITSDSEFDGDHGVNGGSGTVLDPWIISNWNISADAGNAIEIRNTTDYFVIRNVFIYASTFMGDKKGIYLYNVTHGGVDSSVVTGEMECGISIDTCSEVSITWNDITDIQWRAGVEVESSSRIAISSNNITNCSYCIRLYLTDNYTISNNSIVDQVGGDYGIDFGYCSDGVISGNSLSGLYEGMVTYGLSGKNITISGNTIVNTTQAGIFILTDASAVNISGNQFERSDIGLQLCSDISVVGNSFSNMSSTSSITAIYFNQALNVTLQGNTMNSTGVYMYGTTLGQYNSHSISQDNLVNGRPLHYYKDASGVVLDGASVGELIVVNCTDLEARNLSITDAFIGIQAAHSKGMLVSGCNLSGHVGMGMELRSCTNVSVTGSRLADNRYAVYSMSSLTNATFSNNTVIRNWYQGLKIWYAGRINITGNVISDNGLPSSQAAIELYTVNMGNISGNQITDNSYGIYLSTNTVNIKVHHNNFVNNTVHAIDAMSNTWDDGYPSGGNYWDNYTGSDGDLDGIGDTPFVIDPNSQDNYPLMQPVPEFSDLLIPILALVGFLVMAARRYPRTPESRSRK